MLTLLKNGVRGKISKSNWATSIRAGMRWNCRIHRHRYQLGYSRRRSSYGVIKRRRVRTACRCGLKILYKSTREYTGKTKQLEPVFRKIRIRKIRRIPYTDRDIQKFWPSAYQISVSRLSHYFFPEILIFFDFFFSKFLTLFLLFLFSKFVIFLTIIFKDRC